MENLNEEEIDETDEHAVSTRDEAPDRLWLVIRSLKSQNGQRVSTCGQTQLVQEYKIGKFDTLKLGRVKFRVKDTHSEQMNQTDEELMAQEMKEAREVATVDCSVESNTCKICWSNDSSVENPIMTPCKCSGTVGLIHYDCLRSWLNTKCSNKQSSNGLVKSYIWKTFECEICKSAYPYSFK